MDWSLMPGLEHVAYLKMFIGNQVVRRDERACRFAGPVFTLPLHFQIGFCQVLPGFLAIATRLLLTGKLSMQALQSLFCLAIMTRVLNGVAFGVRIECLQTYIDPEALAGRHMHDLPLCLNPKLHIVAIGPMYNPHAFDLLERKGFNLLLLIANEPQAPDTTPISERDVFPIQFPARRLVFDASIIMLKLRIALVAWLVRLAVVIKTGDSEPRPISSRLTC